MTDISGLAALAYASGQDPVTWAEGLVTDLIETHLIAAAARLNNPGAFPGYDIGPASSRSLQLVLAQLAGGEQVPGRIFNTPVAAGPRKSPLSIRPFAPSDNFAPALTSAFTRVEDDLVFAGTKGGLRACRPMYL